MVFEDNFVQPVPNWLIDPMVKARMIALAPRESYKFDKANLIITYDPEIRPGRLTQPMSPKNRKAYLAIPELAHLVDEPRIFESDQVVTVQLIPTEWSRPTDVLRLKVPFDRERMALRMRVLAKDNFPMISEYPSDFTLYCIKSAVKTDYLRERAIREEYPQVKQIEALIRAEVAQDVFELSLSQLAEVEPGWVCVGSREIGQ